MKGIYELVKFLGAIAWIVGLLTMNLFILGFAVLATIMAVKQTRERRHQEMLEATKRNPPA